MNIEDILKARASARARKQLREKQVGEPIDKNKTPTIQGALSSEISESLRLGRAHVAIASVIELLTGGFEKVE